MHEGDPDGNAASATGNGAATDQGNSLDTVDVCVKKVPLKLSKVASRSTVGAGQTLSYAIRVKNTSKGQARKVKTCDRLPAGLAYVSSSPRAKLSGGRQCWTAGRVNAGRSKRYRITVRALAGASGKKVNRVTTTSPDAKTKRAKETINVLGGQVRAGGVTG